MTRGPLRLARLGDPEGRNEDGTGYGGDGEEKGSKGCRWNEEGRVDGWMRWDDAGTSIRCWREDESERYLNAICIVAISEWAYMTVLIC